MYLKSIFLLFNIFSLSSTFNLCVVGGTSGLGRELIFQSLIQNNRVLALTNSSDIIKFPYRGTGLQTRNVDNKMLNPSLVVDRYENSKKYNFENIVFTIGAGPFEKDYSDIVTQNILENISDNSNLKNIILVSANGVGDSLKDSNLGIKVMDSVYLRDAYRAKNVQEIYVNEFGQQNNINTIIIRPKALSYGPNIYQIKSREKLASEILEYFDS